MICSVRPFWPDSRTRTRRKPMASKHRLDDQRDARIDAAFADHARLVELGAGRRGQITGSPNGRQVTKKSGTGWTHSSSYRPRICPRDSRSSGDFQAARWGRRPICDAHKGEIGRPPPFAQRLGLVSGARPAGKRLAPVCNSSCLPGKSGMCPDEEQGPVHVAVDIGGETERPPGFITRAKRSRLASPTKRRFQCRFFGQGSG